MWRKAKSCDFLWASDSCCHFWCDEFLGSSVFSVHQRSSALVLDLALEMVLTAVFFLTAAAFFAALATAGFLTVSAADSFASVDFPSCL